MKSSLSVAIGSSLLMGQIQAANDWEQLMSALSTFNMSKAVEHAKNIDWSQYITTRHDSRATLEADKRRMPRLTREQHHNAVEAHHRIMERRDRLGMPKVSMSHIKGGPEVGQNYKNLASFSGWILNLVDGLQYN